MSWCLPFQFRNKFYGKKLVLFDFDGVLVNTLDICYAVDSEVNKDISLDEYKSFFEGNIFSATRKDGSKRNSNPNFSQIYDSKRNEIKIPLVLAITIQELSRKYTLAIISATGTESIRKVLVDAGVESYFSDILGSDVHSKKSVKIKMLLDKYNVSPEYSVFVTDTLGDIREANECNVFSVGVIWGWHDREKLEKGNPVAIVSDPTKLQEEIENILK